MRKFYTFTTFAKWALLEAATMGGRYELKPLDLPGAGVVYHVTPLDWESRNLFHDVHTSLLYEERVTE